MATASLVFKFFLARRKVPGDDEIPNQIHFGASVRSTANNFRVGRHPANEIYLKDSRDVPLLVSRFHARVYYQGQDAHIVDNNTTNGTYVNGERIEREARLLIGARVSFGGPCTVVREGNTKANPYVYTVVPYTAHPVFPLVPVWPAPPAPAAAGQNAHPSLSPANLQAVVQACGDELTCAICFEYMVKPYNLLCGHSFCLDCLCSTISRMVGNHLRCPLCRASFHTANPEVKLQNMITCLVEPTLSAEERQERQARMQTLSGVTSLQLAINRNGAALDRMMTSRLLRTVELIQLQRMRSQSLTARARERGEGEEEAARNVRARTQS